MDSRALKHGYRSGLEQQVSESLESIGIDGEYEQHKISYIEPEKKRTYTPDFWLRGKNKTIVIETKGRFMLADRKKHVLISKQYPDLDLRFVFTNSRGKISKGSKTTYGDWCTKNGFKYADKDIPDEWIKEID